MDSPQDGLRRVLASLTALKENLSGKGSIREEFVSEYHMILDRMNTLGVDVKEFRISSDKIRPVVRSGNSMTGEVTYSDKKYVDPAYFMFKLDSLLGYFRLTYDDRKPKIGFASV